MITLEVVQKAVIDDSEVCYIRYSELRGDEFASNKKSALCATFLYETIF